MLPGYEKLATQQNMHGTWRQTRRFGTLFQHLSRWRQQMLTAGEAELVRLFAKRSEAAAARAASSDPSHDEGTGRDYDEEINTLADRLSGWLLNLSKPFLPCLENIKHLAQKANVNRTTHSLGHETP